MRRVLGSLLFPMLAVCCQAEDFTLTDGTVLLDVRVQRKGDDSIQVLHAGGIRKVAYELLPPELQERFELTPAQVEARREQARLSAVARRQERRAREDERLAQLEASGRQPRYMNGADVLRLLSPLDTLSAQECEFLAAEWNRREAQRLGLTEQERSYAAEAASLQGQFEAAREAFMAEFHQLQQAKEDIAALKRELREEKDKVAGLRKECNDLREQNNRLWTTQGGGNRTTIVVPPRPVVVPSPVIPPGRGVRVSPQKRPAQHRPLPPPSNKPHTLPRSK